jgi:hypothetical protein
MMALERRPASVLEWLLKVTYSSVPDWGALAECVWARRFPTMRDWVPKKAR